MELNYYSDMAVRLVNTEQPERGADTLTSIESVRELCGPNQTMSRKATEADVARLRAVRTRLRAVFAAASEEDDVRAVNLLNSLLMEFPTSPQISGHESLDDEGHPRWHMHLAEHPANATAAYAATACMGLAFHLTDLGVDRLGICQATPCRNAYLDTSTNRSRRYCSDRCATRANVAAYRARKRLENTPDSTPEADAPPRGRTGPTSGRSAETDQRATEASES
ncbi:MULTISPECIES: CGNR zinc finger domain-containing protein [unclassified Streptomyces]|uniref:CGNR zinc finger domain-containing protein n=1 Tax=unclassified Streptomyces TaxID=2593676 RepID=UPI002DDB94B3|nr:MULTISPECIES: CGNR zinc finger domain-containing protein [unclassified Streptomyces]